jgi:hypothetical protein
MPVFQCVLSLFVGRHLIFSSLVNLNSLSKTAVLKAEFVCTTQSSLSLLMLGNRPAELEYSEWVRGEPIFLSGYLGASGEQIQQLSVFESTLTLDKYMESEFSFLISRRYTLSFLPDILIIDVNSYLEPQSAEQQLLAKLAAGGSISEADTQDLFVGCNHCGAVFLKGYGKGHCADNDNGLTVLKATPEGRAPR